MGIALVTPGGQDWAYNHKEEMKKLVINNVLFKVWNSLEPFSTSLSILSIEIYRLLGTWSNCPAGAMPIGHKTGFSVHLSRGLLETGIRLLSWRP